MKINYYKVKLKKRFPLAISRGVRYDSENLFIRYEKDGLLDGVRQHRRNECASTKKRFKRIEKFVQKERSTSRPLL